MTLISLRCPNCAGNSSVLIGENKYRCNYCDNTFNYVDPNASKITRNVTVTESNHCPICGRGVTFGASNRCTICGTSNFCTRCTFEVNNVFQCKTCIASDSRDCPICGKPATGKCISCIRLCDSGKINKSQISRSCDDHFVENEMMVNTPYNYTNKPGGYDIQAYYSCSNCFDGLVCFNCVILKKKFRGNDYFCKFCGNKMKLIRNQIERDNKK